MRAGNALRFLRKKQLLEDLARSLIEPLPPLGPVRGQHVANLPARSHRRVKSNRWLLENQGDTLPADFLKVAGFGLKEILALK
jgi:hypothetical protein